MTALLAPIGPLFAAGVFALAACLFVVGVGVALVVMAMGRQAAE